MKRCHHLSSLLDISKVHLAHPAERSLWSLQISMPDEAASLSPHHSSSASYSILEAEAKDHSLKGMTGLRRLLPYPLSWFEALGFNMT